MMLGRIPPFDEDTDEETSENKETVQIKAKDEILEDIWNKQKTSLVTSDSKIEPFTKSRRNSQLSHENKDIAENYQEDDIHILTNERAEIKQLRHTHHKRKKRDNEKKYSNERRPSIIYGTPDVKKSDDNIPDEFKTITIPNMLDVIKEEPSIDQKTKFIQIPENVKSLLEIKPIIKKQKLHAPNKSVELITDSGINKINHSVINMEADNDNDNDVRLYPLDSNGKLRKRGKPISLQIESTQTEGINIISKRSENYLINILRLLLTMVLLITYVYLSFAAGPSLFSFHVLFMSICWIYLMTFGLNAFHANNFILETNVENARKPHLIIMLISFGFILIGIIIIFIVKITHEMSHFNTVHDILGLISFVLFVLNLFSGLANYYLNHMKKKNNFISYVHRTLGLSVYMFGTSTIIIKLFDEWWDGGSIALWIIFALLIINMILTMYEPSISLFVSLKNLSHKPKINSS